MQPIVLSPTDSAPIEFDGELLFSVVGQCLNDSTGDRRHEIEIFRTDSTELAVAVWYRTNVVGEREHCSVDSAVDVSDVDNVLSLYDPMNLLVMDDGPGRKRAVETVVRHYDFAVNDVLCRLKDEFEATDISAKPR